VAQSYPKEEAPAAADAIGGLSNVAPTSEGQSLEEEAATSSAARGSSIARSAPPSLALRAGADVAPTEGPPSAEGEAALAAGSRGGS